MSNFLRAFTKYCVKTILVGVSIAVLVAVLISLAFSVAKADAESLTAASAYASASAKVAGKTESKLAINKVIRDSNSLFDLTNHYYVVPTEGWYHVSGSVEATGPAEVWKMYAHIANAGIILSRGTFLTNLAASSTVNIEVNALVFLKAAAKLELYVKNESTGEITLTGSATGQTERLTVYKVEQEGPAGPEGKEGKEGKEGPPGPEGKEGKAVGTKIESFGTTAESTFSEIVERMEVLVWCLVGTIVACILYMSVRDMVRLRKT